MLTITTLTSDLPECRQHTSVDTPTQNTKSFQPFRRTHTLNPEHRTSGGKCANSATWMPNDWSHAPGETWGPTDMIKV